MVTTAGVLNPPLGKCRLAIVNLISALSQLRSSRRVESDSAQCSENTAAESNNDELRRALCREHFLPCMMVGLASALQILHISHK